MSDDTRKPLSMDDLNLSGPSKLDGYVVYDPEDGRVVASSQVAPAPVSDDLYDFNCARCGGLVARPNTVYSYSGHFCACAAPQRPVSIKNDDTSNEMDDVARFVGETEKKSLEDKLFFAARKDAPAPAGGEKDEFRCECGVCQEVSPPEFEAIVLEFQKERTDAISEMFDGVDSAGIYPTGKFFGRLDAFFRYALAHHGDAMRREAAAAARAEERQVADDRVREERERVWRKAVAAAGSGGPHFDSPIGLMEGAALADGVDLTVTGDEK